MPPYFVVSKVVWSVLQCVFFTNPSSKQPVFRSRPGAGCFLEVLRFVEYLPSPGKCPFLGPSKAVFSVELQCNYSVKPLWPGLGFGVVFFVILLRHFGPNLGVSQVGLQCNYSVNRPFRLFHKFLFFLKSAIWRFAKFLGADIFWQFRRNVALAQWFRGF